MKLLVIFSLSSLSLIFVLLQLFHFGLASSFAQVSCNHDAKNFRCVKFVSNYDGDTITVDIPKTHPFFGKNAKIRVLGVDTPELRTKDNCEKEAGYKAKRFVEKAVSKATRIDLENVSRGKYFRIVADVMLDGKSLTKMLLKRNLGVPYYGGRKEMVNWCFLKLFYKQKEEVNNE